MSRKKPARRSAKRSSTSNTSFASMQKMEKDFLNTPSRLNIQLAKEIKALKQRESKLKQAINKNKSQVKVTVGRIKTVKGKNTAISKKQLTKFKKSHGLLLKDQTTLTRQLGDTSKSLTAASDKHAKLIALKKHLSQFEKDWTQQARKAKTKVIKAKVKRSRGSKTDTLTRPQQPQSTTSPQQQRPDFETSINERIDETSETTS